MAQPFIVSAGDAPPPLDVVGEKVTILAPGSRTGSFEVFLQHGPEGSGPPPHSHDWDEGFYVMEGKVIFGFGGEEILAAAGAYVHVPGGTTHWFRYGKGGAKMLSVTSREGISRLFADWDRELAPQRPPDPATVLEIGARHGVTFQLPAA